ncbi:MAG: hypothetical protein AB7S38_39900 [Vulcanimicrobiota bacterium]
MKRPPEPHRGQAGRVQLSGPEDGVCGGHRLVPDEWGAAPVQTDAAGHTLYLNPAHIITILPR